MYSHACTHACACIQILRLCDLLLSILSSQPEAQKHVQSQRSASSPKPLRPSNVQVVALKWQQSPDRVVKAVSTKASVCSLTLWKALSLRQGHTTNELDALIRQTSLYQRTVAGERLVRALRRWQHRRVLFWHIEQVSSHAAPVQSAGVFTGSAGRPSVSGGESYLETPPAAETALSLDLASASAAEHEFAQVVFV